MHRVGQTNIDASTAWARHVPMRLMSMIARTAAVLLLLAAVCRGSMVEARQAGVAAPLVISGHVCARATGKPIGGAQVGAAGRTAVANHDGAFQITLQATRHLFVQASALGYQNSAMIIVSSTDGNLLSGAASLSFCGDSALDGTFTSSDGALQLTPVPQIQPSGRHTAVIGGTGSAALEDDAALQTPSGAVDLLPLSRHGAAFSLSLPLTAGPGRYVLEINAQSGFALIKLPLFVGTGYLPPPAPPVYVADPAGAGVPSLRAATLQGINDVRHHAGLPPVQVDRRLAREAQLHSDDIVIGGYIMHHAHIGANGSTPGDRVRAAGVVYREVGEDVGMGGSVQEILVGLMDSPAHRWSILGNFNLVGIGIAKQGNSLVMTVDFVR